MSRSDNFAIAAGPFHALLSIAMTGIPDVKESHLLNGYCSSTLTPKADNDESDLKEELYACKEATRKLLEKMREFQAEVEKNMEELKREFQNLTQSTMKELKELKELRALLEENKMELKRVLAENDKGDPFLEKLRASSDHERDVDNTRRPLFKRVKCIFGSTKKSRKGKKKMQALPSQATTDQLALVAPEAKTKDKDVSNTELFTESGAERRPSRRKGSSGEVSVVSFGANIVSGIAFPHSRAKGSLKSLPGLPVMYYFPDEFKDSDQLDESEGYFHSRQWRSKNRSWPEKHTFQVLDQIPQNGTEAEPINITMHPKSQTEKEGARVEFKCKVDKKKENVIYQWRKDGVAIPGKNDSTLVLDVVELRDFGSYTCYVKYQDSFNEGKESICATLDVIPQSRNGMRPKRLRELDINTRDEIALLLQKIKFGLGGFKKVAAEYGMTQVQIGALENSREPGNDVLEFIVMSKPDLTVYSFCKTLKGDKFKRCDIVGKLEDHFLVQDETNNTNFLKNSE